MLKPARSTDPWLKVPAGDSCAALNLICFPYAGGHGALFTAWAKRLPSRVQVIGVELPGRMSRLHEPPLTRITDVVPRVAAAIAALSRPAVFFGHSLGALLAFETARWIRREWRALPLKLIVSGRRAPHLRQRNRLLHAAADRELLDTLKRWGGTPPEVLSDRELLAFLLPVLRADIELVDTYCYRDEPPLECPIAVFAGAGDPETRGAALEGWNRHTSSRFERHVFPGGHWFIRSSEACVLRTLEDVACL